MHGKVQNKIVDFVWQSPTVFVPFIFMYLVVNFEKYNIECQKAKNYLTSAISSLLSSCDVSSLTKLLSEGVPPAK